MKNEETRGITLIALVITIIVLLILAGVSISILAGGNGILNKAQAAKEKTIESQIEEEVKLALINYKSSHLDNINLKDVLQNTFGENNVTESNGKYIINKDGYNVTVDKETLEIEEISLEGIQIHISNSKVVSNSDGSGENLGEKSTSLGKKLYINFTHNIDGGETTVTPAIPYEVTQNGEVTFTITGTVDGKEYEKQYTVTVNQFSDAVEPFVLFNGTNDGSTSFKGVNPDYSKTSIVGSIPWTWDIDSNRIYAFSYNNHRIIFNTPIINKGFTTCHVDISVPAGSSGKWNISDISFSKGIDLDKITEYANSGQTEVFKSHNFTYWETPYTLERQVVDIDISGAEGNDFYVGLHNCDCEVYIYKIWFD